MTQITIPKQEYDMLRQAFDSIQNKDNAIFTYGTEKNFIIVTCKTEKETHDTFKKDMDQLKEMIQQRDAQLEQFSTANKQLSKVNQLLNDKIEKIQNRTLWQRIMNR